jgi:type III pantothenate kinase
MNLIFDIGNSGTKIAVYDSWKRITSFRLKELNCEELEKKMSAYIIEKAIISSVKNIPHFIVDLLSVNIPFIHILSHKSVLPFTIEYETPETLGPDRIAVVAGAMQAFPDSDLLVIDAGTAITFDFLYDRKFKGGNISPGIEMRFRALHKFTGKLPLVSRSENFTFPAVNTTDAIIAGVITGVTYEINEYIRTFEKRDKNLRILITGGDGRFLKEKISEKCIYMPDILMDGLNYILECNAK